MSSRCHEVWQSIVGLCSHESMYYQSKRRFIGSAGGDLAKPLAAASQVFLFSSELILRWGWPFSPDGDVLENPHRWEDVCNAYLLVSHAKRFSALPNSDELITFPVLKSPFKATVVSYFVCFGWKEFDCFYA